MTKKQNKNKWWVFQNHNTSYILGAYPVLMRCLLIVGTRSSTKLNLINLGTNTDSLVSIPTCNTVGKWPILPTMMDPTISYVTQAWTTNWYFVYFLFDSNIMFMVAIMVSINVLVWLFQITYVLIYFQYSPSWTGKLYHSLVEHHEI